MKIALYVNSFLPQIGGRELVVHHLAVALNRLGHPTAVIGPGGAWQLRHLRYPYPVHRFGVQRGRLFEAAGALQLLAYSRRMQPDVIHAHTTYPNGYLALKLGRALRRPVVITAHGADIHIVPGYAFSLRTQPRLAPKVGWAVRHAPLLTAISESVVDSYLDAGADPTHIRRVPNGIDLDRFRGPVDAAAVKRELGLPADAQLLLTVGNYYPRKGHEYLIEAMPAILAHQPLARLVIVGRKGNPDADRVGALIAQHGLEDKIIRTGAIPFTFEPPTAGSRPAPDRLAQIYLASALYLSVGADEGAEGLSLSMLDGMACGLPVVATAISGNRDLVRDGDNGLLVPPRNAAALAQASLRILGDPTVVARMAGANRVLAQDYSWERIAESYLAVYREAQELQAT